MKTKLFATALIAALVAATLVAPAGAAAGKKKARSGPLVIGEDAAGDWGGNVDATIAPAGDALGMDLVSASLEMADAETVNFIIGLNSLPSNGGVPELVRYTWNFQVDDEAFQMSGGYTEYIRGVCNPTTPNSCPPPRDPGSAPFFLRQGACLVGPDPDCHEAALLNATFDPAAGTITVPVPLEALKAKNGSKIIPGATNFGGMIYAAPGVFATHAALPHDTLAGTETFVVSAKGK